MVLLVRMKFRSMEHPEIDPCIHTDWILSKHSKVILWEKDNLFKLCWIAWYSYLKTILNSCHFKNLLEVALAGVAQWIKHWPANQKVASSVLSQGTCLGYGPGPQLGTCKRQPIDVSLPHWCFCPYLAPSLPLSLKGKKKFLEVIHIPKCKN